MRRNWVCMLLTNLTRFTKFLYILPHPWPVGVLSGNSDRGLGRWMSHDNKTIHCDKTEGIIVLGITAWTTLELPLASHLTLSLYRIPLSSNLRVSNCFHNHIIYSPKLCFGCLGLLVLIKEDIFWISVCNCWAVRNSSCCIVNVSDSVDWFLGLILGPFIAIRTKLMVLMVNYLMVTYLMY